MEIEPHQGKLEETVIRILKAANLEIATELSVRKEAEKLLGVDLSDLASKRLVRRILESFLLSYSPVDEVQEEAEEVEEVQTGKFPVDDRRIACDDGGGRVICELPGMRRVSIKKFRGTKLVSIREYYQKEGKVFPSGRAYINLKDKMGRTYAAFAHVKAVNSLENHEPYKGGPFWKGITLNPEQWSAFRSSFPDIEAAITKMQAGIRGEGMGKKQTDAEASNPSTSLASEPRGLEKLQIEAGTSIRPPDPLIPIATIRFTGRNYYCWKRQMEFFLKQLKVSYVLVESCPKIPVSSEASFEEISQSKSRAQKWVNDDYICRHSILNSLSDQLFDRFSVKTLNARELWDELKSLYADDFGTQRSHVNSYIQFQMVDGISILEQVQELHRIAGIITTSGIHIDENFHVSVIISKLPPSWKHVRAKLMQEEYLPLDKLIYRLKDEEDSRSQREKGGRNIGPKKRDMRGLCFGCHKEGHKRQDCPLTRSNQRDQNHNGVPVHKDGSNREKADGSSEVNMVSKVVK